MIKEIDKLRQQPDLKSQTILVKMNSAPSKTPQKPQFKILNVGFDIF